MPQTDKQAVVPIPGNVPAVHLRRAQQRARPQLEVPKPHELRLEGVIFPWFYHTRAPSKPLSAEGVSRAAAASLLPQPCSQGAELREAAPRCHPWGEGGNWPPSIWALRPAARRANGGRKPLCP